MVRHIDKFIPVAAHRLDIRFRADVGMVVFPVKIEEMYLVPQLLEIAEQSINPHPVPGVLRVRRGRRDD